jgi:hypothetical protein
LIQVVATESAPQGDMNILLFARAPFLLPIRSDADPVPVCAGQSLALNTAAFAESELLSGAVMALISVGALQMIREGVVH